MQPEFQQPAPQSAQPVTPSALPGVAYGAAPVQAGNTPQAIGSASAAPQPPLGQPATPAPPAASQPKGPTSTQNSLLFSEMRENMIIMNDGSFRAVVECQSINFDLMSSREREGVEYSYQNFLNSLYFPIQILIRSRRVDIGPYLDRLLDIRRSQDNMLLNVLMDDYISFIDILAQEANIMDKSFYVVVPYYPAGDVTVIKQQAKGLFESFFSGNKETTVTKIDQATYEKAKDEIKNRIDAVMSGLFQMGVKSMPLNTRQLSELFYVSYNPDTAAREPMIDPQELTGTYVRKGEGDAPRGGFR